MSGGLDSGSVTALAAEQLNKQGGELHGFTGVANHEVEVRPHKFLDEDYYAGLSVQKFGNIVHHVVKSEDTTMFHSLRKSVQITLEVGHGIGNVYWIQNIADLARTLNVDRMLVGQVGNATVSWMGKKQGISEVKRFISTTIKKINFSIKSDGNSLRNIELHPNVLMDGGYMKYFNPDIINQTSPNELFREPDDDLYFKRLPRVHGTRKKLLNLHASGIGIFWETMGMYQDALYFDPTADRDLVNFCLSLPESFYAQEPGRYLIRKSMDGFMPDEVVWNKRKGIQNADWDVRYEQEIQQFVDYVVGLGDEHKVWGILHKKNMIELLKTSPTSARQKMFRSGHITRSVALMMLIDEIEAI
jgi:asparagine synthase (glutamine-hydrolysing)